MYIADTHQSSRPPPPPPPAIDFYSKDPNHPVSVPASIEQEVGENSRDMMIEVVSTSDLPLSSHHHNPQHTQMVIGNPGSTGEEIELNSSQLSGGGGNRPTSSCTAPKKRAETWVQEETRSLIGLRREIDSLFNTSKSNKHLWEQISTKMREKGFDRSPTMCTDKWRNLLKEFKKVKQQEGVNGSAKMSYYKEIEEILRERNRTCVTPSSSAGVYKSPNGNSATAPAGSTKVDSFLQFSEKGIEDGGIPFGPMEANDRQALTVDRRLDHDAHALSINGADTVGDGGVTPSFWREGPGNGQENHSYAGRVISVKWGDYTRRIGIDGTAEAISHAIKSAFRIRTKRAFWLEDEDQIVRCFDRDMPLGNYHLHLDEGVTIKVCHYNESDHMAVPHTEEKTFYSEEDLREFFNRRGWSSLRELQGYRNVDNLDDLRPDALYRGTT